jgi:hypothetical protein
MTMPLSTRGEVTVQKIDYQGWQGSYRLTNGTVELVFVPQIGRVMRYGYVGEANLLWENPTLLGKTTPANAGGEWINYGGDKLWPAPQKVWGWPPDPVMDSGLQKVTVLPDKRLKIEGAISPKHRLQFVRVIRMDAEGTGVTFENRLLNTSEKRAQWSVWQVTQVETPDKIRLPLYTQGKFSKGYYVFQGADPVAGRLQTTADEVHLTRDTQRSAKIGGDSPQGWIRAEKGNTLFETSMKMLNGKPYPDDGCGLEIYTNPDPLPYIEMELLGPLVDLKPRQTATLTTRWSLKRR